MTPVSERLQIILITYNRKDHARQTLTDILDESCPIHDFDITVLDNNSTDGTETMVKDLQSRHPNLKYVRNNYNLGIGGNIFRAMEIANKEYLWTLCDDDNYNWAGWDDVANAINRGEKVICVSRESSRENLTDTAYQLYTLCFLPSLIISRQLHTDATMRNAFDDASGLFPHLAPVITHINNGGKICVTEHVIVEPGNKASDMSYIRGHRSTEIFLRSRTMSFFSGYAALLANLNDRELRHHCFDTMICGDHRNRIGYGQFLYGIFLRCRGSIYRIPLTDMRMACRPIIRFALSVISFAQETPLHTLLCNKTIYDLLVKTVNRIRMK